MITYKVFHCEFLEQVMSLYQSENWDIYSDLEKVKRAFENSLYILGAFEGERLLGFIRCIGDGEYDLYVSDLIVDKEYRRLGIGKTLLSMAMEKYGNIENFVLMTGLEEEINNIFYRSMGMRKFEENRLVGYIRDNNE